MNTNVNFYPIEGLVGHLEANRPVLTPNHRLARRIRLAWGRRQARLGISAWITPPVMSLEQWWRHCYGLRSLAGDDQPGIISPAQERALWLQCVSESDTPLLRPAAAAELAAEAHRNLLLWEIDWHAPGVTQQFDFEDDSRLFLIWARRFEARLQQLELATLGQLAPGLAAANPMDSLLLAEFGELPPRYRNALASQCAEIIHVRAGKSAASCHLQPCDTHLGELEAAAHWARESYEADPDRRIGVVLPGLAQERRQMEKLLQLEFESDPRKPESLPVNFSAGQPLASCGPVKAALNLLALPVRPIKLAELGQVLMTRYRHGAELERELHAWRGLLDAAREPVTPAMFRYQLERVPVETPGTLPLHRWLLATVEARYLRARYLPSRWSAVFRDQLEAVGWPGPGPLDSLEFQQVEEFQQCLARLDELDRVTGDLDYSQGLAALEELTRGAVFQAQTADAPIQVLGLLEAAGMQFDALWLCNMGADEWPGAARPNPFIPVSLQRAAHMPHADASRELEYSRQLLEHLLASSGELIASFARLEDEVPAAPSSLLDDAPSRPVWSERSWPAHWGPAQGRAGLESVEHGQAPPVGSDEADGIAGGSAILANQSRCPFRAFARHRLAARPWPDPQVALTAAERGFILHDAMNYLWGKLESSERLARTAPSTCRQICEQSASVAVQEYRKRHGGHVPAALLDLEEQRLVDLMSEWLEVERARESFVVEAREQRHDFILGPLSITLRIDRVDELADGRKLVIDYKTGDSKVRLWLGERPEDPQLPLYAQLLADADVAGVGFAVLRHSALGYRGLADVEAGEGFSADISRATKTAPPLLDDWSALQAHWKRVLTRLGQEFLDGCSAVDPIDPNRTCLYCGLEALCRIR